jgi:alpha-glucosidase
MSDAPWWKSGVVYQIYPRSFLDASGDGVGDLEGIRRRLDHLVDVGVDALWISPIFPSPMADFGYDVADYCGVDPLFGSLEDFDRLLSEAHGKSLKVLLDLVPNHTSDHHPWFQNSRAGGDKSDWYIWRDPAPGGGPPNNWLAYFGGPTWTFDEGRGQYYLHQFLPEQPELDHRNPEVREAIHDAMRFWLDKGVDGFRVDVINLMGKHPDLPDDPINEGYRPGVDQPNQRFAHVHRQNHPDVHEMIGGMRAVMDEYEDRVMIGEIYLPPERLSDYYRADPPGCHLPFNFGLITLEDWSAAGVRDHVERFEAAVPEDGWPNYVLGNHDQPRVASRVPAGQARLAQVLLFTLRGTPTAYYGDELGMRDVDVPREKWQDPSGLRQLEFDKGSRDPERTPMQWDASPNAGFCDPEVEPWLPVAPDAETVNVAAQTGDEGSFLEFVRRLLALRRARPALHLGDYEAVPGTPEVVYAYRRRHGDEVVTVALNFSAEATEVAVGEGAAALLLSTDSGRTGEVDRAAVRLGPGEAVVLEG